MALFGAGCAAVEAGTDGRGVDLRGQLTTPGSGGGSSGGGGDAPPPAAGSPQPFEPVEPEGFVVPRRPLQPPFPVDVEAEEPLPEVTIDDLASFMPIAPPAASEPAGWGIVGLETNFHAGTGAQVVEGELLGFPAAVRFTPVRWHWAYGDGTHATTSTPGAPWGSGAEFESTPTSHRYSSTGTYTVSLTVEFGAEYRIDPMPWQAVAGSVTADAEPLSVRIGTAGTVLVERGCEVGSGPGC